MQIKLENKRRKTSNIQVGNIFIGSDYPIRIQTMANTDTNDIDASVDQARRCIEAGAELLRFTTQGLREVESLREIHAQVLTAVPLVADVHFNSEVADAAAQIVEAVRINPGNYSKDASKLEERFVHLLDICREHETAIRIGVNHGSLSPRMMEKYGDTPQGMVESVMEFLRIAVAHDFPDIVISVKASNTRVMVDTVRLLVKTMNKEHMAFPLHLGVTEAGEGEDGRIKSAVGIGALLADGIGDTIRVSLSEAPENEIPVAQDLVDYFADEDSVRYDGSVTAEVLDNIGGNAEIRYSSFEEDWELFCLQAAAECGRLLWEFKATELTLVNPNFSETKLNFLSKDILQAARVRIYKTEYISCPGCGRTLYNLEETIRKIKTATAHLTGLKIAVMGCIVNGPGEMADADYGYVGAGRDRISLYRGKECVLKNIPQEEAVDQLLALIESDRKN
ncbi:MAG: (E)-4-hydroxy-3-methylbut-2-enyl-diphosphate synthase [Paludibacteraceae bacterium]|nr:(E)-4-hydroxy-3-methylbut-2-enyl-diphosphate synthase [Paludibacteraceae bacterium]